MKEPRTEKLVKELKETIDRLNRLDKLLQRSNVSYDLGRNRRDEEYTLKNVVQTVEY
jgi:hypothetical protein